MGVIVGVCVDVRETVPVGVAVCDIEGVPVAVLDRDCGVVVGVLVFVVVPVPDCV